VKTCELASGKLFDSSTCVLRIDADGTWEEIANLSAFIMANPTANENPGDFEPDGTWYSMVSARGLLYAVEPNHGELDPISAKGVIERVADISLVRDTSFPRPSLTTAGISMSEISVRSRSSRAHRRF